MEFDDFDQYEFVHELAESQRHKVVMKMKKTTISTCRLLTIAALSCTCTGCAWLPLPSLGVARSMAVPDVLPLGSVSRAHWHTMETNGEASDFILYRNEFVDQSSELSPYGRDHIMEIAARMSSTPFPILVQRSDNNADPELDAARREQIVRVLTDLGNSDAESRTFVSQPYSDGINSLEAEQDLGRFRLSRRSTGGYGGGAGGGFSGGAGGQSRGF